jgi:Plasmid pRiA4b ORF-3-like protein
MPNQRLPRGKRRAAKPTQAEQPVKAAKVAKPPRPKPAAQPAGGSIYQLKITLRYSSPPIWRRVQVPADISLGELHEVIQTVMGWDGDHLHSFAVGGIEYGPSMSDTQMGMMLKTRDETQAKLNKVALRERFQFTYEYDFGDSWVHQILVEKILLAAEGVIYPLCIEGKRAGPPDDVGGIWGYAEFLEAIADPQHPDHEDRLDWIGDKFDPEAFDLAAVNQQLGEYKKREYAD